ncbi:uncharacterized protein BYT42DRAFT_304869 [Radiomyces spectabilis]|uniref:uncharacterized protein n=1 Tax=Radiomyces spectabilis TaxID=64574 RepID=UPI00221F85C6|nr:uncharacterized protein BYT42DRAFT_304869 [Radiomyces spectabilis]KAI8381416.1 hypothetical protein BYT42DRAFT_304869 [Radiomyces spectabilis]
MEELEHRVKQLTRQMLLWEEDTAHMEEQKRYIKGLLSQWWGMEELITSLQTENRALEERQSQRDSELEQLKIEMKSCQSRISHLDQVSASPKSDSGNDRKEASRLQTMVDELKQRVEQLEVRNLQYQMDLEKARHEEEKFKKLAALSETASHDASGFRRSFDEQAPADMDQTTARHVAPGVNRSLSVTDAEIGLHTHPTAVSRSISDPKHPVLREDDTKHH